MKNLLWILWVLGASEVRADELHAQSLCEGQNLTEGSTGQDARPSLKLLALDREELIFVDQGFCKVYLESLGKNPENATWKVRLYASHSFTRYFNSDVSFQSSRYSVEIKDYEWAERGSRDFFKPSVWLEPGHNPAQVLDEPTNTFTLSIEKDGNEFYLSAFHPKFTQRPNQVKQMNGIIDGVPVDRVQAVNEPFQGYEFRPGESKLVRNEFTHLQMLYEVGYGHRFTLVSSRMGNITYIPHVGVGVQVGGGISVMVRKGAWWDFEDSTNAIGYQGFGGSVGNRLELNSRSGRLGVFYENRVGYYQMKTRFFDGTEKFNLGFVGNSIGVKFLLHHSKPKDPSFIE